MVSAVTMPCDTSQDASPLAVPGSLSPLTLDRVGR